MILETRFNIGEIVYAAYPGKVEFPLTIGEVRKSVADSNGRPGEELFDNYKPQKKTKEEYMCNETGIGSGNVYPLERLFATSMEAQKKLSEILRSAEDDWKA